VAANTLLQDVYWRTIQVNGMLRHLPSEEPGAAILCETEAFCFRVAVRRALEELREIVEVCLVLFLPHGVPQNFRSRRD
jgi:hypothetical protein